METPAVSPAEREERVKRANKELEGTVRDLRSAGVPAQTLSEFDHTSCQDVRIALLLISWIPRVKLLEAKWEIVLKIPPCRLPKDSWSVLVAEYDAPRREDPLDEHYRGGLAQVLARTADQDNAGLVYERATDPKGGSARAFLLPAAVKLSDEAKQEQLLLHALTSDKPLIFVGLEIVRKRKQASEAVRAEIEKLRQHKDRAIRSDAERCWKALLKGPSAGKQTKSHLGRPATPDELKDPNLAETSTEVEGAQLAGFLREVAKLFESGFGRPEVAALAEVADEMEVDQEKGYRYEVSTKGTPSALIVHLFLDDTDSFGVTFLGTGPVIAQVDAVLRQWIERVEQ